jgi:nitrogen fixation NifU-like protein
MFSARLLDHFEHPRNAGTVADAHATVRVENPACGDILELTARQHGGRVTAIAFKAKGCVPCMACASAVTAAALGRTLAEAHRLTPADLEAEVGSLAQGSQHASQLAIDALRTLLLILQSK